MYDGVGAGASAFACPNATLRDRIVRGIRSGAIAWHAGGFNLEVEAVDAASLRWLLRLGHELDDRFDLPRKTVLSQRDVPGLTRAAVPILRGEGVRAVSLSSRKSALINDTSRVDMRIAEQWPIYAFCAVLSALSPRRSRHRHRSRRL